MYSDFSSYSAPWLDWPTGRFFPASYCNSILLHSFHVWGGLEVFVRKIKIAGQILQPLQCCPWPDCFQESCDRLRRQWEGSFSVFPFLSHLGLLLTVSLKGVLCKHSFICLWQVSPGTLLFPPDVSEVFALWVGLVHNRIYFIRPLILVNYSGECDLSIIPWTLAGIHSTEMQALLWGAATPSNVPSPVCRLAEPPAPAKAHRSWRDFSLCSNSSEGAVTHFLFSHCN